VLLIRFARARNIVNEIYGRWFQVPDNHTTNPQQTLHNLSIPTFARHGPHVTSCNPDTGAVPTVDRGFLEVVFCPVAIAGERPSMWSTSGFCIMPRNCRPIGGERFPVPALAFSHRSVSISERGFAGAGDARYHHELVAGDPGADIFEVVLMGTFDDDIFHVTCGTEWCRYSEK